MPLRLAEQSVRCFITDHLLVRTVPPQFPAQDVREVPQDAHRCSMVARLDVHHRSATRPDRLQPVLFVVHVVIIEPVGPIHIDPASGYLEIADLLRNSVRDIAANLLAEEGIGSHELGYLYSVLIDHVSKRMLGGKTIGTAGIEELWHALNRLHQMSANLKKRPGLVASIVNHKREAQNAHK